MHLSRRITAGSFAGLLATAALPALASPDTRVAALCRDLELAMDYVSRVDRTPDADEAELDASADSYFNALAELAAAPAQNRKGLRAKAAAARRVLDHLRDQRIRPTHDETALLASLTQDMLRLL